MFKTPREISDKVSAAADRFGETMQSASGAFAVVSLVSVVALIIAVVALVAATSGPSRGES